MTSKDKTGEKLVASIKKSKTGEVARKTAERSIGGASKSTTAKTRKPAATSRQDNGTNDAYSSGPRVWPD